MSKSSQHRKQHVPPRDDERGAPTARAWIDEDDGDDCLSTAISAVTKDAIVAVKPDRLHILLCLDGYNALEQRAYLAKKQRELRMTARRCRELAKLAEDLRLRFLEATESNPSLWRRVLGRPRGEVAANLTVLTTAVEVAAMAALERILAQSERVEKRTPRHDAKGVRQSARVIRARLAELTAVLRAHDEKRWTMRAIAKLIRASREDWTVPPCPNLARREERVLVPWLEKHLERARQMARRT